MSSQQTTDITARLYDCRRTAQTLLGARYDQDMKALAKEIQRVSDEKNISTLAAATSLARGLSGHGQIVVLAAFVEMTEPSQQDVVSRG